MTIPQTGTPMPSHGELPRSITRSIVSVQLLVRLAADHGLDAQDCLASTGLTAADIAAPHRDITPEQELRVIGNLVAALPDVPALGLEAGARYHLGIYGVWGFALATSPTPRALAAIALRYLDLSFAFVRFDLAVHDATGLLTLDDAHVPAAVRRFVLERDFAAMANAITEIMPGARPFQRVDFAMPQPAYARAFEPICGVRPCFDQPRHRVVFQPGFLDTPLPRGDALIARACDDHCRRLMQRKQARQGLSMQVRDRLLRSPHRMPDCTAIAGELHLSPRTLRRKLMEEGTSFRSLSDEVRRALAEELLTTAQLKLDEVASRLGYSDAASFIHAFKRWTGESPASYRQARWR